MIDRFKTLLLQLKLSPSEFADKIGVQRSSVSHVLSGRNKPGLDFLEKILNTFPEIDANWLITGKKEKIEAKVKVEKTLFDQAEEIREPVTVTRDEDPVPYITKKPPQTDVEAVDHIIIVYKNNTFRLLKPESE
jgi:transcriptional regulator with XRE-family HTH domain